MTETQKLRDQLAEKNAMQLVMNNPSMKFDKASAMSGYRSGFDAGHSLANEAAQKEIEDIKSLKDKAADIAMALGVEYNFKLREIEKLQSQLTASNSRCEELEAEVKRLDERDDTISHELDLSNARDYFIAALWFICFVALTIANY
jgi:chromosome segregation ATPase